MSVGLTSGRGSFAAALTVAALLVTPASASAATITPNTTADAFDTPANATCSLREAIQSADQNSNFGGCTSTGGAYLTATAPPGDIVQVPAGTYRLSLVGAGVANQSGDLNTTTTMTIQADPGAPVAIDGNGTDRVLFASTLGVTVTLDGLTITNGFVDNPAPFSGINGGAIFTSGGTGLAISDSTISGNRSDGSGGGIDAFGPTTLTNVTISGNTTTEVGGSGLATGGTATLALDHVTIAANRSAHNDPVQSNVAGGISAGGTTATIHNSVIAGNTSANTTTHAPDCQGTLTSTGGNVIGDATGCTVTPLASDALGTQASPIDALLAPLANAGGPTFTHALMPGSPAIDQGVATCAPADQRGVSRPFPIAGACDSGAFEKGPDHTLTVNAPVNGTITGTGVNCHGDCTETYTDGSNVPLMPNPATGFLFDSWSGDCTGSGSCAAIMDANRTVGASFAAVPPAPSGSTTTAPSTTTPPVSSPPRRKKCKKRKHHATAAKRCKKRR